jgi:hypothetical protein
MKLIGAGTAAAAGLTSVNGAAASEHVAQVGAVHGVPDAPAVDIYANGDLVASDVSFRDATSFLEVEPGTYTLVITPTGRSFEVARFEATFEGGKSYVIVALGVLDDDSVELKQFELETEFDGSLSGSTGLVRAIHASPDAGEVDATASISRTDEGVDSGVPTSVTSDVAGLIGLLLRSRQEDLPPALRRVIQTPGLLSLLRDVPGISLVLTLVDDLSFGAASDTLQVPAGDYEIELRSSDDGATVLEVPATVPAGVSAVVIVLGFANPEDAPADEPLGATLVAV